MSRVSSLAVRERGRYFDPGSALNRVLLEAPFLARCSDDKTAGRLRPREYALAWPYMQLNRPGMVSWLIFDLDHANSLIWQDENLPAPNLVVRNRTTGSSHLFYAIPPVCTTERARSAPIEFMRAVYEAMAVRLRADPRYASGPVAKTPGHPWWDTWEIHPHTYELGKLADFVDLPQRQRWSKGPDLEAVAHSRHCMLFEQLRWYAYSIVGREKTHGSYESFVRLLDARAHNLNAFAKHGFSSDLPLSSLRSTVKSIGRWTWNRYSGSSRCNRGVMQLDPSLPLAERQRLAAQRSNELRAKATASAVRAACRQLLASGKALALTAIARLAGITRQTVAAYRHVIAEAAKPPEIAPLPTRQAPTSPVKYGAHQVSAAVPEDQKRSRRLDDQEPGVCCLPEPGS